MSQLDSSLEEPPDQSDRTDQIVGVWNSLRTGDDPGATNWEVLERLEREVTDCLAKRPPDVMNAWSKTAKALLLIAGGSDA